MLTLSSQKRTKEAAPALRTQGSIPAVFYGRKEKSTPIIVKTKDFIKVWKEAGESSIISLKDASGDEKLVLIQDVDRDPVTDIPIHADFYVIEKDAKLKIKIPIEYSGVAPAIKDFGGILVKVLRELEIESLPANLPRSVTVDVSGLADLKSQILAKDITLPTGVALVTGENEVVAAIAEAKEEEEKPPEPIDLSTIEVEKKGKEASEEGTEEAAEAETPAKK